MGSYIKHDLMEMLSKAGYQEKDVFHHYSDLYVFKNDLTTKVIKEWIDLNNLAYDLWVSEFNDAITDFPMYEICFQYHPMTKMERNE